MEKKCKVQAYNLTKVTGYKEGYFLTEKDFKEVAGLATAASKTPQKKAFLLIFGGEWCLPCREMMPNLVELLKVVNASKEYGIVFFSYVFKDKLLGRTLKYNQKNQTEWMNVPVIKDGYMSDFLKAIRIQSYPYFLIISDKGQILWRLDNFSDFSEVLKNENFK